HPVPGEAGRQEGHAREDAGEEDRADDDLHVGSRPHHPPRIPRTIISMASTMSTARKMRRTVSLVTRTRMRVPTEAPAVTPRTTGAASPGSMRPAARQTLVPASALTPMIRLLVVVETLGGSPMTRSWISTFKAPAPMPSSPAITPAPNMRGPPRAARPARYSIL